MVKVRLDTDFDLVEHEDYPKDANGKKPKIYLNQEVVLEKGSHKGIFIDIAHVLCGLDAFNHQHSVYYSDPKWNIPAASFIGLDKNVDAVTWIGDLGSALAEAQVKYLNKERDLFDSEIQRVIDEFSSPQDMLGTIDTYGILQRFETEVQSNNGMKVSEILHAYYLGNAMDFQDHRYVNFSVAIGAVISPSRKIQNWDYLKKYWTDQINDSAALYILALAEKKAYNIDTILYFAGLISMNNFATVLAESFLTSLETAMASE